MTERLRILLLEDNASDAELIEFQLEKAGIGFVCELAKTRAAFLQALKKFRPDLILADYTLPGFNALNALKLRKKETPLTPFIIITGSISEEIAVECMKQGADDYLLKDRLARLGEAVRHSLTNQRLKTEKMAAEESLRANEFLYRTFIDSSTDMAFLKDHQFRHLLANQALCRFYGKTEKMIIGKTDFQLMGKSAAAMCRRSDKQALVENRIHVSEETVGGRTFETSKFPVKLTNGRIGVGGYIRDVSERKRTQEQIEQAARKWTITFDTIKDGIALLAVDQTIMQANQAFADLVKKPFREIIGKKCYALIHPNRQPDPHCPFAKMQKSKKRESMELTIDDRMFVILVDPITNNAGALSGAIHIITDITERKRAEEHILASLREKEVLLKEIHHRVKNNLQIISGLLTLQAAQINDERLQRMLKESQSRIWTMALIHQTLYQSGNLADIDMADYIRSLVGNLLSSHAQVAMPPTVSFDLLPLRLVIDKAIPLALIINELVTNAMKHAFPDGRSGEIRISLQERSDRSRPVTTNQDQGPAYELIVADNGAGLPVGFDPKNQKSLGLQLVTMLVKQLGGSLAFESSGGTSVAVTFDNNEKNEKQS